ncbi:dipeptide ABC transporter ATP-binding protein [Agrobacterium vitis]|uniref:Dipeptide ABC transporter ATP-binding protein n=1 Tax=Agrobacterium vitis TaxID=373 RepID=A0ABD6GGX6_AGRVI|nr:ABC transporter ATP-binding protein [Agrobacterium vitis]MUO80673.1 dipeptide ABC transporter ATP-binding protein [Agrobacterium vitis]MUO96379.1 dipeptide ABC transporter ATP-binding protein [Agrobacterium vitis]MUP07238.1 dipeptide ABC transporter ATP-binding protein [Agrobacterium vitis]MUZ82029.1 dipeptide ABC transporter ATP-binding protein [Agrobacterium vitis]MVA09761.1 dipeptide ABC transporter ATP-binding protein [Agrobacterium vitis]
MPKSVQDDASEAGKLLSVQGLTVGLPPGMDRRYAVEDMSFDLKAGEILCIIGESGSGKSVTANATMGLLAQSLHIVSGSIMLEGQELVGADDATLRALRGRVVSMIFQDPLSALNPLMTVGDQIAEVMEAHGIGTQQERRVRVLELITEVGLPDPELMQHQYPFRLSGGQRQRVMIAMALALEPKVLIADEPTTALDVTTQAQILELIASIQRRKQMSVMFITHDFGVVAEIADRVIVMEKGHVVEQGPASVVLKCPDHPYTQRLLAAVPRMRATDRDNEGDTPVVLEARNLCKTYGTSAGFLSKGRVIKAVDDVSFTIAKGRTLGIVGESGSGKSSLGRLLVKLMNSDSGEILFGGRDIAPLSEEAFRPMRPYIQMIFQDPFASLNPRQTIGRILTVGPVAQATPIHEARTRAMRLLERVGLDAGAYDRYPHEFSGGQRQRIGIARALMFNPMLIVADEAVSALDVSIQAQILQLLTEVQQEMKLAMAFITHDLRVASQICDEIAVMYKGRIVEYGPPSQIFRNPTHDYTRQLVSAIPGSEWEPAVMA